MSILESKTLRLATLLLAVSLLSQCGASVLGPPPDAGAETPSHNPGHLDGRGIAQAVVELSTGHRLHIEAFLRPDASFTNNCVALTSSQVLTGFSLSGPLPGEATTSNCAFVDFSIPPAEIVGASTTLQCRWGDRPYECVMWLIDLNTGQVIAGDNFKAIGWTSRDKSASPFRGATSGNLRLQVWLFAITPGFEFAGPE